MLRGHSDAGIKNRKLFAETDAQPAAFEPSLDYVVVKIPRWAFEKFPGVDSTLGPQMKSVGEVMALGRTFPEALNKAIQSLEIGVDALDGSGPSSKLMIEPETLSTLKIPTADRLFHVYRAIRQGLALDEISQARGYDLWFLAQMQEIANCEMEIRNCKTDVELKSLLRYAKQMGFADSHIARLLSNFQLSVSDVRNVRRQFGIMPTFQRVDTCAAEFEAQTPYLYSAY